MLIELFDKQVLIEEPHERGGIYPSELTNCRRCIWYDTHNTHKTNATMPNSISVMNMGNIIEDYIIDNLEKNDEIVSIEKQVVVKADIPNSTRQISGKLDGKITYSDGTIEGLECKSGFGYTTTQIIAGNVKEEWIYQVASYLNFSDINVFRIFYFDRGHGYVAEFRLWYDEAGKLACNKYIRGTKIKSYIEHIDTPVEQIKRQDVIDRCVEVDSVINSDKEPDRLGTIEVKKDKKGNAKIKYTHWKCGGYCNYQDHCWKDFVPEESKLNLATITAEDL